MMLPLVGVGLVQTIMPGFLSRWDVAFLGLESLLYILLGLHIMTLVSVSVVAVVHGVTFS